MIEVRTGDVGESAQRATIGLRRALRSVHSSKFVLLLALVVLLGAQRPVAASAADGLPPGVPVPAWAKGKWVHFEPAENRPPTVDTSLAVRAWRAQSRLPAARTRTAQGEPSAARAQAGELALSEGSLRYFGGPVENEPRLVLVFWGKGWTSEPGPALAHQLEAMAEGLPGSGYQKILTQYSSIDGPIGSGSLTNGPLVEKYYDPRAIPADIGAQAFDQEAVEVTKVIPPGSVLNTTYAVLPSPGTTYAPGEFTGACGWHALTERYNESSKVLEVGALAAILGTSRTESCFRPSFELSHEYAESVTDPGGAAAWGSESGQEIADLCSYLGPGRMADGARVAPLWDDSKNACEVEDDNPDPVPIGPYTESSSEGSTNPTAESVTLETSLEPCGLEAHYYFEYDKRRLRQQDRRIRPSTDLG